MKTRTLLMVAAVGVGLSICAVGCGPVVDGASTGVPGRVCYVDADCVPDACCGTGSGVVHIEDAPSCRGIQCTNSCDPSSVDCGCGIPVCRDQRCTVARTVSDKCPAR